MEHKCDRIGIQGMQNFYAKVPVIVCHGEDQKHNLPSHPLFQRAFQVETKQVKGSSHVPLVLLQTDRSVI